MKLLTLVAILLALSCAEAPFEPQEQTPREQIDSLTIELAQARLNSQRWAYLARCNYDWFIENNIPFPCHGGV